ncbi:hypothetical protein CBF34_08190 [Vagococcus penaei]|uniref:Uncharacterized protein n=1 Tax=Vagococcus penaei TaxID=633807 RepID=A0A1Q2D5A8_9ENTE|nr:hypothetical protein [Vagococcus penaei]AQP53471.1 hypothetical protein BW732_03925 [Vagococcus penaei]RSU00861.1 hypothetical protein CBF34_08190 [Vagococcus penaei]
MTNFEEKKDKVIDEMVKTLEKLDLETGRIQANEESDKKHSVKIWFEEKRALHEVKRLLHEIGKYDKYDEKELEKFEKEMTKSDK